MTKEKNNKNRNLIILAVVILVTVGVFVLINLSQSTYKSGALNNPQQTKTFQSSDVMDFYIVIPEEFKVDENFTSVIIVAGSEGKILIGRSGTNFDNLNDYLDDLNTKNRSQVIDSQSSSINEYAAVKQKLVNEDLQDSNRITYFIYVDGWVYSLSTSSESLYDDLDQIAKSFKYTGE